MVLIVNMYFLSVRAPVVRKCFGTENLTEYDENCWHLMKLHNRKFDIQTGCWSRVRKEQSGLSTVRSDFPSQL